MYPDVSRRNLLRIETLPARARTKWIYSLSFLVKALLKLRHTPRDLLSVQDLLHAPRDLLFIQDLLHAPGDLLLVQDLLLTLRDLLLVQDLLLTLRDLQLIRSLLLALRNLPFAQDPLLAPRWWWTFSLLKTRLRNNELQLKTSPTTVPRTRQTRDLQIAGIPYLSKEKILAGTLHPRDLSRIQTCKPTTETIRLTSRQKTNAYVLKLPVSAKSKDVSPKWSNLTLPQASDRLKNFQILQPKKFKAL